MVLIPVKSMAARQTMGHVQRGSCPGCWGGESSPPPQLEHLWGVVADIPWRPGGGGAYRVPHMTKYLLILLLLCAIMGGKTINCNSLEFVQIMIERIKYMWLLPAVASARSEVNVFVPILGFFSWAGSLAGPGLDALPILNNLLRLKIYFWLLSH